MNLKFIKKHWPIILILVLGAFLRFYRIRELTTFGGDQGIDFLVVKRIIIDKRLTLLGPITSVGIYLGPLYYYLLVPTFLIFNLDPVGPAYFFTLVGLLTILLVYKIGEDFLDKKTAIFAASLYAISPLVVESSRAASQPHLLPFIGSLFIYSFLKFFKEKKALYLYLIASCLGMAIQFHYLSASLFFITLIFLWNYKKNLKFKDILIAIFIFLFSISGQIFFELRHKFFITNLIINFLKKGDVSFAPLIFFKDLILLPVSATAQLLTRNNISLSLVLIFFVIFNLLFLKRKGKVKKTIVFITLYFLLNILFFSFYKNPFLPHYLSLLYPATFLILSISLSFCRFTPFSLAIFLLIFIFNFLGNNLTRKNGYTMPEGWNMVGIERVADIVASDAGEAKFNIAATLDGDTRARPYRYVLEAMYDKIPLGVEDYPEAEVLYVVSRESAREMLENQVWEISCFRPRILAKSWHIQNGIFLYKLEKI